MTKKPKNHIAKSHDHFFRMAMSHQQVARDFFAAHLSQAVQTRIDLNSLELQPSSYIDDMRQEAIADLVYRTNLEGHSAYLFLLVDHQSQPDELMAFRMIKYTCNIIDQHLKDTGSKRVPLVLPLVVYHGKQPWTYSTDIKALVDAPKPLIDAYFLQPFTLVDLTQIDDAKLKANQQAGIIELTLKHIFAKDMLPHIRIIIESLKRLEKSDSTKLAEIVLTYILDRGELKDKEAFVHLVKAELPSEIGDKIMTLAEQFKAEGMQQGVELGKVEIARRMLAKNIPLVEIQEITGLTIEKLQELNGRQKH